MGPARRLGLGLLLLALFVSSGCVYSKQVINAKVRDLDTSQIVTAQLSGRMRRFRIRVIPGDRVQVGVSPYDPTHGFITFRLREGQTSAR